MAPAREPPVCRVAATPYPAYKRHWAHHCTGSVGPRKRSAAGHGPSRSRRYAGWRLRLTRPTNGTGPTIELDP
ncbi:hypothetical protein IUJ34_10745 [Klebsiella pneumoniae subsp. pneumoniae]|uniref:Uncharacterized protein n=1 Tax=Klebsiella pneumoniae subsp. pneumoniae TaxID=72407 RepID=A0A7S9E1J7_KLEPN|nr:hypothetical protein IUJ34_10745 [Klebsiella pneumoniae subsp. pneumoniae]